jgi:hypothetical protein
LNEDNIKKINDEIEDLEKKIYTNRVNKIGNTIIETLPMGCIKYDLTDDGTGKKYDCGKSMVGTLVNVFPNALMAVGMCIEFGTHKYPNPNNWKQVEGASKRYQDSLMRHLIKHNVGIEKDSETGIIHLAHMTWNALAILELYLMEHPEIAKEYLK